MPWIFFKTWLVLWLPNSMFSHSCSKISEKHSHLEMFLVLISRLLVLACHNCKVHPYVLCCSKILAELPKSLLLTSCWLPMTSRVLQLANVFWCNGCIIFTFVYLLVIADAFYGNFLLLCTIYDKRDRVFNLYDGHFVASLGKMRYCISSA